MNTRTYKFTGYYPSGNPFLWLYDETKRTMFTTSNRTAGWDKEPKIGDIITLVTDDLGDDLEVTINGEIVFKRNPESIKKQQAECDSVHNELLSKKGFDNLKFENGELIKTK